MEKTGHPEYDRILYKAKQAYQYCKKLPTRREVAEYFLSTNRTHCREVMRIVYAMLDNKPYTELIWEKVKANESGTTIPKV